MTKTKETSNNYNATEKSFIDFLKHKKVYSRFLNNLHKTIYDPIPSDSQYHTIKDIFEHIPSESWVTQAFYWTNSYEGHLFWHMVNLEWQSIING